MIGAMYTGITGMDAAAEAMNVIGNNIANVNTAAFKTGTISFASIFSENVGALGNSAGNEVGKGVQVVGLNSVWEQGNTDSTMNQTDFAITGDGFFKAVDMAGTVPTDYFTRAGQFRYDDQGYLTDPQGRRVRGYAFDDALDPTSVNTSSDEDIRINAATHTEPKIEGNGIFTALNLTTGNREYIRQVAVFNFPNNDGLRKVTGNLYEETLDSGEPSPTTGNSPGENGAGTVTNNNLEMSNVDLAREFVDLIISQRAFQANSRVISSTSDMLTEVINIIR